MRTRSLFLSMVLAFAFAIPAAFGQSAGSASAPMPSSVNPHVKNATAVGEISAQGELITAAILEYDREIDGAKLSAASFSVKDRNILRVYANSAAEKAPAGVNGRFVVIELDPSDAGAAVIGEEQPKSFGGKPDGPEGAQGPGGPGAQAGPGGQGGPGASGGTGDGAKPKAPGMMPGGGGGERKPVKLALAQVGPLAAAEGGNIPAQPAFFETNSARNLVIDDFQQLSWTDPVTGTVVRYNLFVPRNYDKRQSYPLVLFMHDASVGSPEHDRTLVQGLGAVIWATPEEQAKHPCFVLATQFNDPMPRSLPAGSRAIAGLGSLATEVVYRLLQYLPTRYSIDPNRLYTTGQSAGCMNSLAMMIEHPDLFAAALLVSGQQDPQATSVLKDQKMWIVVSEGDPGGFPGMNASAAVWEQEGARVVRGRWSAHEPAEVVAANVAKMVAENNNIMFTSVIKGTTLPAKLEGTGASEHMTVMRYAYTIEGIRDWLFDQTKAPAK